nr:N-acetyltransferase ESCO2 [Ciona intestinalis]|eukprot:XP_002128351.2 N-acetyltransferase ESCO2 [Ciona intestinalis]
MTNCKPEVATKTFYGKNVKYLSPVQRGGVSAPDMGTPIVDTDTKLADQGTKIYKENTPPKQKSAKKTPKPPTNKPSVSPTISWAPNSLKKQFTRKPKYSSVVIKGKPLQPTTPIPQSPLTLPKPRETPSPPTLEGTPPSKYARIEGQTREPSQGSPRVKGQKVKEDSKKLFPIFTRARRSSPLFAAKVNDSPGNHGNSLLRKMTSSPKESPKVQLIIDAGQKKFGATQCKVCGMVYAVDHPHDQHQHKLHHQRFNVILRFPSWKNERTVASYVDGRIVKILPTDPKFAQKKVEDILELIDSELGFSQNISTTRVSYLYVSDQQQVTGCLIAEQIKRGFPLLETMTSSGMMSCSLQSTPVTCGVSRIWCHAPHRKRGVATRLMDALRCSFVLGERLNMNQVAFSDPTISGKSFATKYFKTPHFLTYNCST